MAHLLFNMAENQTKRAQPDHIRQGQEKTLIEKHCKTNFLKVLGGDKDSTRRSPDLERWSQGC